MFLTIEKKIKNLEKLLHSFIESQTKKNDDFMTDVGGCRDFSCNNKNEIIENTKTIEQTEIGLMETYEETTNNAVSIDELELALEEVFEMITEV